MSSARTSPPTCYYRLDFTARSAADALWAAVFFDAEGTELVADVYDSVEAAAEWRPATQYIRAHALAAGMRLRFRAGEQPLRLAAAAVAAASPDDAGAWTDAVAVRLPPVCYAPRADRAARLPKTFHALRCGGSLRLVMLGDSICNDTSNSLFELALRRRQPLARIDVVTSVHGGAGCRFYREGTRVRDYVLRFAPDLVVVAGISHGHDPEAFRDVLRQIRAGSACECLVLTGAIAPPADPASEAAFAARLRQVADAEGAAFFDVRSAWDDYLSRSPRPGEWFRRDSIHGNTRGKQVAGRLLARFLTPDPA